MTNITMGSTTLKTTKFRPIAASNPERGGGRLKKFMEHFPDVTEIADLQQPVEITVQRGDQRGARPHDQARCAMAKACIREMKADGAWVNLTRAYVVFGTRAVRASLPISVQREIVTFDRHQDFSTGVYRLSPVAKTQRLGHRVAKRSYPRGEAGTERPVERALPHHVTARVRA